MSNEQNPITVLIPDDGEALAEFERRIADTKGEVLIVFGDMELTLLRDKDLRKRMLGTCKKFGNRLRVASRSSVLTKLARAKGIRAIETVPDLRKLLGSSPTLDDALREFQPSVWRQQLRSKLQTMGLLSLPKLRIWVLVLVSVFLFGFIVFRLLPSATITVWPREETISQTANIFLAQSGAIAEIPSRVRVMDLIPVTVRVDRTITFDQVSKEFIGTNATTVMKVINESVEPYWLKEGTRVKNEAGMIFRLLESIKIEPGEETIVKARSDSLDIYGEILGKRGNVPVNLKWTLPGLDPTEQQFVYAINVEEGKGADSTYRTILDEEDIVIAKKQLETELLSQAKQLIDERKHILNAQDDTSVLDVLYYDELTHFKYVDFVLPEKYLGLPVTTVPIEGSIVYTMYLYDTQKVLTMLSRELKTHVGENKVLLEDTLSYDRLITHVIDYEDDFSWIKITVDLSGTEQYVLEPLSPTGAVFAKKVRSTIKGLRLDDAERIVSNFPEVKKAEISVWPPWTRTLPRIPSSIIIEPVLE